MRDKIVLLAWHVDYWDRLGWKDPFASPAYTLRQRQYVPTLKARGLVTPQLLVGNARYARDWKARVDKASAEAAAVGISAEVSSKGGKVTAVIGLTKGAADLPATAVVRPVLYQRAGKTVIPRGENKGKTLRDFFVVRAVGKDIPATDAMEKGAKVTFPIPSGVTADNLGVVVLVEDPATMTTIEAADFPVAKGPPVLIVVRETDTARKKLVEETLTPRARAAGFEVRVVPTASAGRAKFARWLRKTRKDAGADESRTFVLGLSDAAPETLRLLMENPNAFTGVILVAARMSPEAKEVVGLPKLPAFLVYGKADTKAPVAEGEKVRDAMKAAGVDVLWRVVDTSDHDGVLEKSLTELLFWAFDAGK